MPGYENSSNKLLQIRNSNAFLPFPLNEKLYKKKGIANDTSYVPALLSVTFSNQTKEALPN